MYQDAIVAFLVLPCGVCVPVSRIDRYLNMIIFFQPAEAAPQVTRSPDLPVSYTRVHTVSSLPQVSKPDLDVTNESN